MYSLPIVPPADSRPDLAFQDVIVIPNPPAGGGFVFKVSGDYILFFLSIFVQFHTANVAIARNVDIQFKDADGNPQEEIPAVATQGALLDVDYTWMYGIGSAYSTAANAQVIPLPPILQEPGTQFTISASNSQAGDFFKAIQATVIKIPTGPPLPKPSDLAHTELIPTPVLI